MKIHKFSKVFLTVNQLTKGYEAQSAKPHILTPFKFYF